MTRPPSAALTGMGTRIVILAVPAGVPPEHAMVPARRAEVPAPPAARPAGRFFFAEPGRPGVVCWSDFKSMLSPQLEHPDRLRDSHRLHCRLQVYEALAPQPAAPLAAARFQPLTEELDEPLGLAGVLPPRMPRRQIAEAPDGTVMPGERFFRLRVASDPTRDLPASVPRAARRPETARPGQPPVAAPAPLRRAIPEKYLNAWEFKHTREEVLYDMNQIRGALARFAQAVRRWFSHSATRRDFRKWQALLAGKNADDQLFTVRPPRGALDRVELRDWAARTLALAGYDPAVMLVEWEIYWRRKGL